MLDPHTIDVLTQYGLRQHVTGPTHISSNTLDLILSRDEQISEQLVSMLAVESMCFSDHHLLTCHLGVPLLQPVTMTYTYRSLHKIHTAAFSADILQSRLYGELELDADGYVDAEVKQVLDIHAPLRTGRCRCGQRDRRHLLDEARQAKQQRWRLERRYRRTGLQSDKEAYLSACSTARESILKSRADHIKSELDEAACDVRAT